MEVRLRPGLGSEKVHISLNFVFVLTYLLCPLKNIIKLCCIFSGVFWLKMEKS